MNRFLSVLIFLLFFSLVFSFGQDSKKSPDDLRKQTIQYGTDSEIVDLIRSLSAENTDYLDNDLITMVQGTKNGKILSSVFTFFSQRKKTGLEERALLALQKRDEEASETVEGAIKYLGVMKDPKAMESLKAIIDQNEKNFVGLAIEALGLVGGGADGEANSEYLIEKYKTFDDTDENRRIIIQALGELKSKKSVPFLSDLATNNDERTVRRMSALEALAKIGDSGGESAVISALSTSDPNVRASAVGSLGPFNSPEAEKAILEAFRDSFYKTRIGAAKAAAEKKMVSAVPYLRYRAQRDEVAAVQVEAVRSLGAIADSTAKTALETLFNDKGTDDRLKIIVCEMLVKVDPNAYVKKVIGAFDSAKANKNTALSTGLSKVLSTVVSPKMEDLALRFLTSSDFIEKLYGLQIIKNNHFTSLVEKVKNIKDEKNPSLNRKITETLDALGSP
jgi:HEAT repeat protein